MTERDIERKIIEALSREGLLVIKIPNDALWRQRVAGTLQGAPDLVVVAPGGRVVWLEVKTARGYLSQPQKALHRKLKEMGHHVEVVRSVEEALAFVRKALTLS